MTPTLILAIPALLAALIALALIGRNRRSKGFGRFLRVVSGFGFLLIALALGVLALAIHNYSRLHADVAVAHIALKQVGPQHFTATLTPEAGEPRVFELHGDQWEVDARVVRWQMPARLAGVPPLYRLERISGRYLDIAKEREATRSLFDLTESGALDLWTLKRQFPAWLPFVDADFGSGAYLPMVDGGQFDLLLSSDGGLVAKPADQATRDKLHGIHW
ncbi:MAG: hypothetical protein ABI365_06225 [Lysobacteraceae bacterium]